MRGPTSPVLFAALLLPLALPVAGQQFQPKTIQFKGAPQYSFKELMDAAGLKQGAILTSAQMNACAKRLMDSGIFDDLAYKFDGVDLVFKLTPAEELYPVRIDNLPLASGPELDAQLHARFPLYHGKVPAKGALLDAVRDALADMIAAQGLKAAVTAETYSDRIHRGQVAAMNFRIPDPPVRMGPIRLEGATQAWAARAQSIADNTALLPFDSENSPRNLEDHLVSFYREQGYAAVQVDLKRAGPALVSADSIQIPYSATIQEGKIYRTDSFHLPPNALLTQIEADNLAASRNDPSRGLGALLSLIRQRYKSKGYLDLTVTPRPALNDADASVDYTIDIQPGPVYRVSFVKFENVSDELRALLMRKWQLLPGEPFDETYLNTFILKAQEHDPVMQKSLASVAMKSEITVDPVTHDVSLIIRLER